MRVRVFPRESFSVTSWGGGTTTEFYLYPPGGSYARRDFAFRISSAHVTLPESDFTLLPGVTRFLTPLEEPLLLTQKGAAPFLLPPGEVWRFDGGVPVHCQGWGRDLNLMLCGAKGSLSRLQARQSLTLAASPTRFDFLYAENALKLFAPGLVIRLAPASFLLLEPQGEETLWASGALYHFMIEIE